MAVETVDSVNVVGATVMAGHHEDGSIEVRIWATSPVNPRTVDEEVADTLV